MMLGVRIDRWEKVYLDYFVDDKNSCQSSIINTVPRSFVYLLEIPLLVVDLYFLTRLYVHWRETVA